MTKEELQTARLRICHHIPQCICGDSMTDMRDTNKCRCDECGRLYYLDILEQPVLDDNLMVSETVIVIFNGFSAEKTFKWEL